MKVLEVDPQSYIQWDQFLINHPGAEIYHHSLWKELIQLSFRRLEPKYLVVVNGDGKLIGITPGFISSKLLSNRLYLSLPMASYCDPLFQSKNAEAMLIKHFKNLCSEKIINAIQINAIERHPILETEGYQRLTEYVTHFSHINLPLDALLNRFHKSSIQQRIRRANRFGLTVRRSNSILDIEVFYRLHLLSRKRLGLPALPLIFFETMWKVFYNSGMLDLLITTYRDVDISAMILLKFKDRVYSEYTVTDPNYFNRNPNHFIIWKAMEIAHFEGYKFFDFGRSSIQNIGLINFKKRWGTKTKQLHYYSSGKQLMAVNSSSYWKIHTFRILCRQMPPELLKVLGNTIYRYIV